MKVVEGGTLPLVSSAEVLSPRDGWRRQLGGRTRMRLDAQAAPAQRLAAAREVAKLGLVPIVPLDAPTPDAALDLLLEAARTARQHALEITAEHLPWLDPTGPVTPGDREVGHILCRALLHAEAEGDSELRAAIDRHAGYRRLIDGVPADSSDPLDLRYDVTHAPAPGTTLLTLIPTRRCQLRCNYCMVRLWDEDSEVQHLERAVQLLFSAPGDSLRLQFYGGEPLLRADLVERAVEHGRQLEAASGKRLAIVLITNGVAMTPEMAAFARAHDVEVLVSLDGQRAPNNQSRIAWRGKLSTLPRDFDTYAAASAALVMLREAGARHQAIITLGPERAADCLEAIEHVRSLGVTTLQICYAMGVSWGEEATEVLRRQFAQILDQHGSELDRGEWQWVNLHRNEPLLLDTALQVETDGRLCFMNECMFEKRMSRKNYGIASVHDPVDMASLGAHEFHNAYLLMRRYADVDPGFRQIMLDNIRVGKALGSVLASYRPVATGRRT